MTTLLDQAVASARELSEEDQERAARMLIAFTRMLADVEEDAR